MGVEMVREVSVNALYCLEKQVSSFQGRVSAGVGIEHHVTRKKKPGTSMPLVNMKDIARKTTFPSINERVSSGSKRGVCVDKPV